MRPFTIVQDSPLAPGKAWAKVTDWPQHGAHVPLTTVRVDPPGPTGLGSVLHAVTALTGPGFRLGFDDVMEITAWAPPGTESARPGRGHCRLDKRGTVMAGWAELTVEPLPGGSRVTWTEVAKPAVLPAFTDPVSALGGRVLFARVLRRLLSA